MTPDSYSVCHANRLLFGTYYLVGILYHIFQFFVNPFFDILINFFGCKLQQQVAIVFKSIANVAESRWLTEEGAKRRPEGASGARLES